MSSISLRSMIAGFATGMAVGVTPAAIASSVELEDSSNRIDRLGRELGLALDQYLEGRFRALVEQASRTEGHGIVLLQQVSRVQS